MNYLVIDDENHARESTRLLIQALRPDFHFLGAANSLATGRELIERSHPELVFLDIELQDGNGFQLLESLPARNFATIFVTAYASHALRAFQFAALDYLLKPIDPQLLQLALGRLMHQQPPPLQLQIAQQSYQAPRSSRLLLPTLDGFLVQQTEDIIRCEADANYTHFHVKGHKPILASHNLAHYEELLASNDFVRVHHKHLVNLAHVVGYQRGRGGTIAMSDRSQVEVSVRKRDEFLLAMQRFAKGWR